MQLGRYLEAMPCLALALVVGCGATDADDDEHEHHTDTPAGNSTPTATATQAPTPTASPTAFPEGDGQLAITFRMEPDWYTIMPADDVPPVGPFSGEVYPSDQVTSLGPNSGADVLAGIYVEEVVLDESGGPTAILFTTGPIPAGEVAILGFLDSDGNASEYNGNPDKGDPVTLPGDNRFVVRANQVTTVEVFFNFLNP